MSVFHNSSGNKSYFTTPNTFEKKFGYHRAVRKRPFIFVSGTTSLDPETGRILHPDDAYQQALTAMRVTVGAIQQLGGGRKDVVRVRMFVARQKDTAAVGEAFQHHFAGATRSDVGAEIVPEIGCAATMIVVKDGFIDPDMLLEVEFDAVVG